MGTINQIVMTGTGLWKTCVGNNNLDSNGSKYHDTKNPDNDIKKPVKNYLLSKKGCEVYVQCSVGLFSLQIGPPIKGSKKKQETFEQAMQKLKMDLNTTYLLNSW